MERQSAAAEPFPPSQPMQSAAEPPLDPGLRAERSFASVMGVLERLSLALHAPLDGNASAAGELQEAVCACVAQLRAHGVPPEQVLVRMKALVWKTTAPGTAPRDAEARVAQVVQWCIRAYYRSS